MRRSRLSALLAAATLGVLVSLAPSGAVVAAGAKPAPVEVKLKPNGTGRVVSDRSACVRRVDVFAFVKVNGEATPAGQTVTDVEGRFPTDSMRRRQSLRAFALTLGNAKCKVAQSDDVTVSVKAGKPAARKVSLKVGQTDLSGRVTSKRASCVKQVPVPVFGQFSPGEPWTLVGTLETDNQGRYDSSGARLRGGQSVKLAAVVLGDKSCRVAQSPIRTLSGARR